MSAGHGCCRVTPMSEAQGDEWHTRLRNGRYAQTGPHGSDSAVPATAKRRTCSRAASLVLRDLGMAVIAAVITFAVVLLVYPDAVEGLAASSSADPPPAAYPPLTGLSRWRSRCCPAS